MVKAKTTCLDCGKELSSSRNKRCRECYIKEIPRAIDRGDMKFPPIMSKEENPNWKGGLPKCRDCGKELSQMSYIRCKSCSSKGKLNPNYKLSPEKCSRWNGGVTSFRKMLRNLHEYRQWRDDVYFRDDYTCQSCGAKGKYLNAHHIKSFQSIIEENRIRTRDDAIMCRQLWNINNGITLCKDCHLDVHNPLKGKKL